MKRKKGQITILLVLAMVLLLVFGLMLYIRGIMKIKPEEVLSGSEVKKKVTEAVEACVQHATQEGLRLVGMQGGAIYKTQVEGTAPLLSGKTLLYEGDEVLYAIREGEPPPPPEYPVEGPLGSTYVDIGKLTLKPLCDADGPNVWNLLGAEHTCISYDHPGSPHSIQDYLRVYILNKSLECMAFSEWASQYGTEIVPQGDAELEIIMGDKDVTVQLTYPLEVGGSRMSSFAYLSRVRLKKIYELAYRLAEEDIRDLTFFVDEESSVGGLKTCPSIDRLNNNELCLKPGMSVEVIDAPCTNCIDEKGKFADIVRIVDEESLIVGEPYVFQFARENRRPALDPINETELSGKYKTYLQKRHGKTKNPFRKTRYNPYPNFYDVVVTVGDEIELIPYGLDPDEDELTYYYEGWLTNKVLKTHKHQKEKDCRVGEPCNGPFGRPVDAGGGFLNKWEQNAQGDWRTHKTSYNTSKSEPGYKLLRITVCDTENLCDWQDIGILVNDKMEFTLDVPSDCCTNCELTLNSNDKYYLDYSVEVFYDGGYGCAGADVNSLWPKEGLKVVYAPTGGNCSDSYKREVTVRVTDDFGSSAEQTFTACS